MPNLNKVFLIGNLTNDPIKTEADTTYTRFGLAVNQGVSKDDKDDKKEHVCFLEVVAFSRLAEVCQKYLKKGKSIFLEGRLHHRKWEQQGQKRNKLTVVAQNIQFLSPPKQSDENPS